MRKLLSIMLGAALLTGCSSGGSTPQPSEKTAEETASPTAESIAPESSEIQITLDNWQDYFEIYYEPGVVVVDDNEEARKKDVIRISLADEDLGKEIKYWNNFKIALKDEYKDLLDTDKTNLVAGDFKYDMLTVRASVEGDVTTFGEPMTCTELQEHSPSTGIDECEIMRMTAERTDNYTFQDGYGVGLVSGDLSLHTEELQDGYLIDKFMYQRDTAFKPDPNNPNARIQYYPDINAIWGAVVAQNFEFSRIEGTIYLVEK